MDFNATQAAIRAWYSKKTANPAAARLLANVNIQAAIQKLRDKDSARAEITRERVLEEYCKIAFGDIRNVVTWDASSATLVPSEGMIPEHAAMISEVSQTITETGGTTRVKLYSKLDALAGIRKQLGYDAPAKHEVTGEGGGPIPVMTMADMLLLSRQLDPTRMRDILTKVLEGLGGRMIEGQVDEAEGGR